MTAWLLPLAVGFATGILSAWGVGGGTLLLLCMTLLLGVDHFLDMGRSATNVLGNAIASCVVSRSEGALDEAMDDEAWARQQAAQVAAPVALHPAEASES